MAVTRLTSGEVLVTGMTVSQTPEAQTPAAFYPSGVVAIDSTNGRLFRTELDPALNANVWRLLCSWTGLDSQQCMIWGGAALTISTSPRILDAYSTTRNGAAVVGGITAANFQTVSNLVALYDCRVLGFRWTRTNTTGSVSNVGVFRNGALAAPVLNIAAGGPFSGVVNFVAPVALVAGDRVGCQATFAVATTNQFIVQAIVLPPT